MATDVESIVAEKENVLPTTSGRSASKLAAQFSSDRRALEHELREGHAAFRQEIKEAETRSEEDEDEDRLDVYHRYIKWTLASYPSGPSHTSHLIPLLEEATRRFVKDARYKADLRYLRLWILYAKYIDSPRDIYRFLNVNEIGTQMASMYEEWAGAEEAAGSYKQADAIFQLGLARRAEPLSRLKKRRDAFQARMLVAPPPREESPQPAEVSNRPVLGGLPLSTSQSSRPTANGKSFAVFSDSATSSGSKETASWEDVGTVRSRKQENDVEAKPWVGERMPMATTKKSVEKLEVFRDQVDRVRHVSANDFSDHAQDAPQPPPPLTSRATEEVFSRSIRGPSEAELLRQNPFRHYAEPVDLGPSAPSPSAEPASSSSHASGSQRSQKTSTGVKSAKNGQQRERVALNLAAIYPADQPGVEYTYEELAAFKRQLRSQDGSRQEQLFAPQEWQLEALKSREPFAVDDAGQPIMQDPQTGRLAFAYLRRAAGEEERRRKAEEAERLAKEAALQRQREREAREQAEAERLEAERREEERLAAELKEQQRLEAQWQEQERLERERSERERQQPPSPTINTKAALEEVNEMFGKTMHFDDLSPSRHSNTSTADDSDATEEDLSIADVEPRPTQSQSQPCDFVENSFWGPLSSQQSQPSQVPPSSGLSTRAESSDEDSETETEGSADNSPASSLGPSSGSKQQDASVPVSFAPPERKNRFAAHIDVMTPLTERTLEYTALSRASVGMTGVPMLVPEEEDEDETTPDAPRQSLNGDMSRSLSIPEGFTIAPQSHVASPRELIDRTSSLTLAEPVSVYSSDIISSVLATYEPCEGLVDLRPAGSHRISHLQKVVKKKSRRSSAKAIDDEEGCFLELGDEVFAVREKLGEGAFAAVFRVASTEADESFDDERNGQFALKVEVPTNIWEFSVLEQVHARLASSRAARSVVAPQRLYAYKDESYLLLEVRDQGTLLDIVNAAPSIGVAPQGSTVAAGATGLDEAVAMFFVVDLLRTVEELHQAGFLHGDLKIDNCLVRLCDVPGGVKAWSSRFQADGGAGWAQKGITLIDFGRCIDLHAFAHGTRFTSKFEVDPQRDCPEILAGRPWTYEPDYFGVASVAFTLLFGRRLATVVDGETGRVGLERGALKRYHQTALWTPLFDLLLNPKFDGVLPRNRELRDRRLALESWLEENSDTVGRPSLRQSLKKIEIHALAN